ncbi:ribosomal protein S12 methylthiotransferase [Pseudomonas aeruginosa]|nr:ribosomal protein S12 methylthiotransferase [Pseudomonas aeruginosa]
MSTPTPKVGFVSLGCPKALVDSERILTQLRMEGYEVVPTYEDADVVVVNTCGFIDSAKAESLEVIGEAIAENGKVIVTGCMAWKSTRSATCIQACWRSPARNSTSRWLPRCTKWCRRRPNTTRWSTWSRRKASS